MSSRTALITGIAGQDGSYLAELLLAKGYRVIGLRGAGAAGRGTGAGHIPADVAVLSADLLDVRQLQQVLQQFRPDEIYNLAARASSSHLFADPVLTGQVNGLAPVCMLEAIAAVDPRIRFCQASSSEMFGNASESPQDERTPFRPRNAYGAAKLYAHWSTVNYREAHGRVRLFEHPVQPRKSAARRRVRDAQDQRWLPPASSVDCNARCNWVTWKRVAIGVMQATMSKRCGGCCRRIAPTTTSSRAASRTASANSASSPSPACSWTIAIM